MPRNFMTGISTEIIVRHVETLNDVVSTSTDFITLELKMEAPLVRSVLQKTQRGWINAIQKRQKWMWAECFKKDKFSSVGDNAQLQSTKVNKQPEFMVRKWFIMLWILNTHKLLLVCFVGTDINFIYYKKLTLSQYYYLPSNEFTQTSVCFFEGTNFKMVASESQCTLLMMFIKYTGVIVPSLNSS